jgi:ribose transport system ATP-binding protein
MTALLSIKDLVKEYPGARALGGVDLEVESGQVHCLVGQNGAGKSTLIKCVSGVVAPTSGEIRFNGELLDAGKPSSALGAGVATIYQELDLVDDLSIAANVFLGHEKRRGPFVDLRAMRKATREILTRLGHGSMNPDKMVRDLGPASKQIVSMARALSRDVKLLILDEPSAVLDPPEVDALLDVVRRLKAEGVGVIYISHRLDEIARIGDRITVLRDGKTVAASLPATTPVDELINMMVGQSFDEVFPERNAFGEKVVLEVSDLTRMPLVNHVSFKVREGEIVGIAGLVGAGRTELLRSIFGIDRREGGTVSLGGTFLPAGRPDVAIANGLGLAPEERKSQGLWLDWTQVRNATISDLNRFGTLGFTDSRAERKAATPHLESLRVHPKNPMKIVRQLSGGNQQKVVLAHWLLHDCKVLLLDEPTRGVDVGAKADVYRVITELAKSGLAIVMVSSELAELVGFCHRVVVMREGQAVAELEGASATEEDVLRHAVHTGGAA